MRTPGASCLTIWGQVSSIAFNAINETLPIVSTNVRTQTSTKYRSGRAPSELGRSHEPGVNQHRFTPYQYRCQGDGGWVKISRELIS